MLKFGIISDVDPPKGLVRVNFDDDEIVSNWIPVSFPKAADDEFAFPYDKNNHVWCIMDDHCENGVVGGAIYDAKKKPSLGAPDLFYIKFKDGTVIKYDRGTHVLNVKVNNASYELTTSGHSIKNGSETLKKIISDLIDAITQMTNGTSSGPTTAPPINASAFAGIKTRLSNLLT
jgi:phage baseplate assembly protein gpV